MRIVSGSSSEYIYFVAVSTSDFYTRVTGLTSFGVTGVVNGSTASTGYNITVSEVNSTQMPGVYKALIGDSTLTALPSGIDSREVGLQFTSSMATVTRTFELYRRTATTGATLTVNSSGEPTNVMAKLSSMDTTLGVIASKVSSIETNTTGLVTKASSIDTNVTSILNKVTSIETNTTGMVVRLTSVDTNVASVLAKLTSVEANTTAMVVKLTSVDTNVASVLSKVTSIDANTTGIVTKVSSIDTKVTAIQAQTTQLSFTQASKVDANIHYVNNVQVQGVGTTVDTWRPV